jgi:ABC-type hemin transport system ATPase subunit
LKEGQIIANGYPNEVMTCTNIKLLYGCNATIDENPITKKLRVTLIPHIEEAKDA